MDTGDLTGFLKPGKVKGPSFPSEHLCCHYSGPGNGKKLETLAPPQAHKKQEAVLWQTTFSYRLVYRTLKKN